MHSVTMLTVNADDNVLLRQLHKPTDEKRMVVVLRPEHCQLWLEATPTASLGFMRAYPAEGLQSDVVPDNGTSRGSDS